MRGKTVDGEWAEPFDPRDVGNGRGGYRAQRGGDVAPDLQVLGALHEQGGRAQRAEGIDRTFRLSRTARHTIVADSALYGGRLTYENVVA